MPCPPIDRSPALEKHFRIWKILACVAWTVLMAVLVIRTAGGYHRSGPFKDLLEAGLDWTQGEALYTEVRGFVYSPLVAAAFAPLAHCRVTTALIPYQLLNAAALLGGFVALLSTIFPRSVRMYAGFAALLLIPFAEGNLDTGQSNPLLAGLIMGSLAAVRRERWWLAAALVALATALKIYPLAIGLLICVVALRPFGWRLLVALLLAAAAPFLFQHWPYVSSQYHAWILTRTTDNRSIYPIEIASLDAWFLLHWVGHLEFPRFLYTLFQIACGGAIALLCAWGKWKRWGINRLLITILCLGSIWMTLLGPATEAHTYLLLTPAVILGLIWSFVEGNSIWLKTGMSAAFMLQLFAVAGRSLMFHYSPIWILAIQPVSAVVFLAACLCWLLNDACWPVNQNPAPITEHGEPFGDCADDVG